MSSTDSEHARLCVLGAGNTNDLDLSVLLTRFDEVHLIDIDVESVDAGVSRQGFGDDPRIVVRAAEVTGVFDRVERWTAATPLSPDDLETAANATTQVAETIGRESFHVVASVGLLSQLMLSVVRAIGETHPSFMPTLQAIRLGHMRLLADLLVPGGVGLLITDVVSSDSCNALHTAEETQLPVLLTEEVRRHNFFHGVNPFIIEKVLRTDPVLAQLIEGIAPIHTWKWDVGPRVYAVCGFGFRIKA